jgi:multidrug efflux pump subunit AcrB
MPPSQSDQPHYLIGVFTRHPLASNLLMIMLVLAGFWGIRQLTIQLNPPQEDNRAVIEIAWPGAAAEDIEKLVTQPVELQLRSLPTLNSLTSRTIGGSTQIRVLFDADTDMGEALEEVRQRVAQVRELPSDMEPPVIRRDRYLDTVGAILLTGTGSLQDLMRVARDVERDLLARGIDRVDIRGAPAEEIAIEIDSQTLFELGTPLTEVARQVLQRSTDVPAGSVGGGQFERRLRSLDQRRDTEGFARLPISQLGDGSLVRLGDVAHIERRLEENPRLIEYQEQPAIMLQLRRDGWSDLLASADILYDWQEAQAGALAELGIETTIWLEAWKFAIDQISLVLRNGLSGLMLVIATLFLFLNGRVGGWITAGIPVAFLGALAIFYAAGGTINFLSMVGIVMAIGIVVDDAIVVGEHALAHYETGVDAHTAAARGAQHMFAPVMASSLTTLAAFLPLLVIDEASIREIPLLMVCVIVASLVECFLILPGHLRHSFQHMNSNRPGRFRQRFNTAFDRFRNEMYLPLLRLALGNRRAVLGLAFFAFALAMVLLVSGRIKPDLEVNVNFEFAEAHMQFAAGVSDRDKQAWLRSVEQAALAADQALGGELIVTHMSHRNWATLDRQEKQGPQYAAVWVELVSPDERMVTLTEFTDAWHARMGETAIVENLQFANGEQSWPDLQLYLSGGDLDTLKQAAEALSERLATWPGVSNVFDDLPYGKDQWVFSLTTEGRALGLTSTEVGRQLRAAFEGERVQLFTQDDVELEVRVSLPESERSRPGTIRSLPITAPGGQVLPLAAVADITSRRGIEQINHRDTRQAVNVYANVDTRLNTSVNVIEELEASVIPEITARYGVSYGLGEQSAAEARVLQNMLIGAVIALALIYLVLAWICASWSWPLAVMAAIPLGLTGALAGLYLMDMNLGALAILGVFTLTGVIVNDSIILIDAYRRLRDAGKPVQEALEEACLRRLRPVILTSLTTTMGLAPLMLEDSPMGAMMNPLATVVCFGLLYGTSLILLVIPAILSALETRSPRLSPAFARNQRQGVPREPDFA